MKLNKNLLIFSLALLLGAVLGFLGWKWYSNIHSKIPDSATLVMHNIREFGEFFK